MTASRLRENIYNILDTILETGEPVEIERKGRLLRITVEPRPGSRLSRMKKRPGMINGDPGDLAEIEWPGQWNPEGEV